jgi:tetratricopeptide (TPR) repeat protein
VKQIGCELGVRYVLEGSVRKAGQRVRITAQLIDAQSGTHLWADRFEGSVEEIFELQDKVAISVAGIIEPTLQAAEILRSAERPTNDLTAYDLYLRALPAPSSFDKDRVTQALDLLRQAIKRDPRYGPALVLAAICHHQLDLNGWTDDRETNRRMGVDLARQALLVGGDDSSVLARAAFVLARFGEDIDAAIALVDRSLILNPGFALGWACSGYIGLFAGQPDLAIEHFESALRLSPRDRNATYLMGIGMAQFMARRFEEAAATLQLSLQELPHYANTHRFLAACYAQMGRLDEAREVVKRLRAITPSVMPNLTTYWNREQRELYLDGLRLAAGEVG